MHLRTALLLSTLLALTLLRPALAGAPGAALAATADVLFELDIDNASYKARDDGYVDILFGPSLSDARYREALARLRAHPDIPGILAGRGGQDYCPTP